MHSNEEIIYNQLRRLQEKVFLGVFNNIHAIGAENFQGIKEANHMEAAQAAKERGEKYVIQVFPDTFKWSPGAFKALGNVEIIPEGPGIMAYDLTTVIWDGYPYYRASNGYPYYRERGFEAWVEAVQKAYAYLNLKWRNDGRAPIPFVPNEMRNVQGRVLWADFAQEGFLEWQSDAIQKLNAVGISSYEIYFCDPVPVLVPIDHWYGARADEAKDLLAFPEKWDMQELVILAVMH